MATVTLVNIGAAPNDGNGDPLRTAFSNINGSLNSINAELVATTTRSNTNETDIANLGALSALDTVDTAQIDNSAVTLAKVQDIATDRFLGRVTAATGVVEELTAAQMRTALNVADGATANANAAAVPFTPDGSIAATNVQAAIVEVRDEAAGSPAASAVTFAPDGSIVATNVQDAIVEVRDEAALASHTHTLADITDSGTAAAANTGTGATNVILGNDARLTDARAPTAHTHTLADVTDSGALAALDDVDSADILDNAVGTTKIADDAVTLAKIQNITTDRFLGRVTAATGIVEELTAAQMRTALNVADGATANANAAAVPFTPDGSIAATNVQDAIVEVRDEAGGSPAASAVSFTPDGSIAATNVQDAIVEVRDEAALASHTHTLADITDSGTAAAADTGTGATNVILGNDARLTDARTPTAHTHTLADVTDSGTAAAADTGTGATNVILGNDARLTDARTPTAHTHTLADVTDSGTLAGLDDVAEADILDGAVTRGKLGARAIDAQTDTAHAIVAADQNGVVTMDNAAANTVTINTNATTALNTGHQTDIIQLGAGVTTIDAATGVTLNDVSGGSTTIQSQFGGATIIKLGTDDWWVGGDIAAVA